jgi:hypothetical protein
LISSSWPKVIDSKLLKEIVSPSGPVIVPAPLREERSISPSSVINFDISTGLPFLSVISQSAANTAGERLAK